MEHDLSHQAMDIKANAKTAIDALRPYRDVLLFAATLLVANAVWKMVVSGDEYGRGDVTVFGMVATPLFDIQTRQITDIVYTLLHPIRENLLRIGENNLRYENGPATMIVWSCTPLKQAWIWMCLIGTTLPLRNRTKWWYIPLGWAGIYVLNILRIASITLIIEHHPEWFEVMHGWVMKYLFYGIMFIGWVGFTLLRDKKS